MKTPYQFEIIPKDWSKRRKARPQPKPISVTIDDFKLEKNHYCTMHVTFDDGSQQSLLSRVLQNHITGEWKVDGMHVAVKVVLPEQPENISAAKSQ